MKLDETMLQLESVTQELLVSKEHSCTVREELEKLLSEERSKTSQLLAQIEELSKEKEALQHSVDEYEVEIKEKDNKILVESETLRSDIDTLTHTTESLTHELESSRTENLKLKSLLQQQEKAVHENKELYRDEKESLEQCISELRASRDKLLTQVNNVQHELATSRKKYETDCLRLKQMTEMLQEQVEHLNSELEGSQSEKESADKAS